MGVLRTIMEFFATVLDRSREPGWPRRGALLVLLSLAMLIPYPLSITGDFEIISLNPLDVHNRTEGTLTEVLVRMGDEVAEGQVVARLLDTEANLELARIDAELAEADARLKMAQRGSRQEDIKEAQFRVHELMSVARLAELEVKRMDALVQDEAIPLSDLDRARTEHTRAAKILNQAKQQLLRLTRGSRPEEIEQAQAAVGKLKGRRVEVLQQIEWTQIRAPKSGRITTSNEAIQNILGSFLDEGTSLLTVVEKSELVARVTVDEKEFGDVELDQPVLLRPYQYPTVSFRASVTTIQPFVDRRPGGKSTVSVFSSGDDSQWYMLRVHTTGKAKISLGNRRLGYVIYRRILKSRFVNVWSWY